MRGGLSAGTNPDYAALHPGYRPGSWRAEAGRADVTKC